MKHTTIIIPILFIGCSIGCSNATNATTAPQSLSDRQAYLAQKMGEIPSEDKEIQKTEENSGEENEFDQIMSEEETSRNWGNLQKRQYKSPTNDLSNEVAQAQFGNRNSFDYQTWRSEKIDLENLTIGMGVGFGAFIVADAITTGFYISTVNNCLGQPSASMGYLSGGSSYSAQCDARKILRTSVAMSWSYGSTAVFLAGLIGAGIAKTIHKYMDPRISNKINVTYSGFEF
jgi:hypothetical protein